MTFPTKKYIYLLIVLFVLCPFASLRYVNSGQNYLDSANNVYVLADNVPDVDLDDLPKIKYKWENSKIEMLIIIPDLPGWEEAVTPLMEWKNEKGVKTIILSNFSEYPGVDKAERIRNMIINYSKTENIQWVLLCGDAQDDLIPIREVYNPDVDEVQPPEIEYNNWNRTHKPTDFYYSDLTGSWDDNENDRWGESALKTGDKDEISWTPDVYVGRLPADNAIELEEMINKTLKYETNPYVDDWMGRMLLGGVVSTYSPPEDEARLTQYIWQHYTLTEMNFTHLYDKTASFQIDTPDPPNIQLPITTDNFDAEFDLGYSTVIFAGHGTPFAYEKSGGTAFYNDTDARTSNNINKPSLVYADACTTSSYDKNDNNIGEELISRVNGGAIGYIGGLRVTWYFQYDTNLEMLNRGNAKLFWREFFVEKKFQQGKALYDSKVAYMNSDYFENEASINQEWERKNILTYCLLGDPEVDIYTDKPKKVEDPFTEDIYEGQLISLTIRDNESIRVPYARIHLRTADGKYRTVYADINGEVEFHIPDKGKETYNVTITGHNLVPSYFNFTTLPDKEEPNFDDHDCSPENPTVSDNICFIVETTDSESGIESVFLLESENNFKDYTYYLMSNSTHEEDIFEYTLKKLDPGEYSFVIVARDWAGNTEILYKSSFKITIHEPLTFYILIIASIVIVCVASVSVYVVFKERKKFSKILGRS
ncbi:MAG: C25 family cysteine peptidase [Promethearchaeota archaeon]